jgi:hypothetical protein
MDVVKEVVGPVKTGPILLGAQRLFKTLLSKFDDRVDVPIEIYQISDALIKLGFQDEISIVPSAFNSKELRGTFYSWTMHRAVYGEPIFVAQITYDEAADIPMQRVICAKELVHACESPLAETKTVKDIEDLLRILPAIRDGKLDINQLDPKARSEIVAVQKGLMLLFPIEARLRARKQLADGIISLEELVSKIAIPMEWALELLKVDFEEFADRLREE